MKNLIIYYSFMNNNELLANKIKSKLNCDIVKIVEIKKRNKLKIFLDILFYKNSKIKPINLNLKEYDNIILISPIWAGRIANPLKTFIKKEFFDFNNYSFISICLGADNQTFKIKNQLTKLTKKEPKSVKMLEINSLLPEQIKDSVTIATNYHIDENDLAIFNYPINRFLEEMNIVMAK